MTLIDLMRSKLMTREVELDATCFDAESPFFKENHVPEACLLWAYLDAICIQKTARDLGARVEASQTSNALAHFQMILLTDIDERKGNYRYLIHYLLFRHAKLEESTYVPAIACEISHRENNIRTTLIRLRSLLAELNQLLIEQKPTAGESDQGIEERILILKSAIIWHMGARLGQFFWKEKEGQPRESLLESICHANKIEGAALDFLINARRYRDTLRHEISLNQDVTVINLVYDHMHIALNLENANVLLPQIVRALDSRALVYEGSREESTFETQSSVKQKQSDESKTNKQYTKLVALCDDLKQRRDNVLESAQYFCDYAKINGLFGSGTQKAEGHTPLKNHLKSIQFPEVKSGQTLTAYKDVKKCLREITSTITECENCLVGLKFYFSALSDFDTNLVMEKNLVHYLI